MTFDLPPPLPPVDADAADDVPSSSLTPELLAGLLADGDDELAAWTLRHALEEGSRAEVYDGLLAGAMALVGERWATGRWTVAEEHLLSASVRSVLGTLTRGYARIDTPGRLVFATPAGELHELGTLGAATLAASGGLGVIYLGQSLPAEEILRVALDIELDAVVLGVTAVGEGRATIDHAVAEVARQLPRDVELWLGGAAAGRLADSLKPRVLALDGYEALSQHLTRLGARF